MGPPQGEKVTPEHCVNDSDGDVDDGGMEFLLSFFCFLITGLRKVFAWSLLGYVFLVGASLFENIEVSQISVFIYGGFDWKSVLMSGPISSYGYAAPRAWMVFVVIHGAMLALWWRWK